MSIFSFQVMKRAGSRPKGPGNDGKGRPRDRAAVSFVFPLLLCAVSSYASGGTEVAARVNGVEITNRDVNWELQKMLPASSFHGNLSPERISELRGEALEERIRKELLVLEATRVGMQADAEAVGERIAAVEKKVGGKDAFTAALKSAKLTLEAYTAWMEKEVLAEQFFRAEVSGKASVGDAELKEYFDENRDKFLRPEAIRVREILISVDPAASGEERTQARKTAEELLQRLKNGEDFGGVAYKYSGDRWAMKEGNLGMVHRGQLHPPLEAAAFSLEAGKLSDVVETIYGYHLLLVDEKLPQTRMTFDQVREKLRGDLEKQRKDALEKDLMERLRTNADIVILGGGAN